VDNPFQSPAILSLCSGFLGLERGVERAIGKINIIAYVEIEAFIIANLIAGMQAGMVDAAPVWTDIKTFDAKPFHKKIHGIMGGYPCQPFSFAGKRKGKEDPRHLWPFVFDIIGAARPVWCWFENVSGHLSMGFDVVYKDLRSLGYAVEAGIFTAEEAGAPHRRERLFILAIDEQWMANTNYLSKQYYIGKNAGNDKKERLQKQNKIQENEKSDTELAHTISTGQQEQRNNGKQTKKKNDRTSNTSEAISNTISTNGTGAIWVEKTPRWTKFADFFGWPARPGNYQHEWEEPRTIKSGMGSTINGYNFREDLLRAYGNSVVEQQAEIAFVYLLNTHFENKDKL
jgi:site-specific DNA-cytosine methylase